MTGSRVLKGDFAFTLPVNRVPDGGVSCVLEATAKQCRDFASETGIVSVSGLRADLEVRPWRRDGITVEGRVRATVTQTCVVSLEDFADCVDEAFIVRFNPPGDPKLGQLKGAEITSEMLIDPDSDEDPAEDLDDGILRLGDIAREYLVLGLDPYPKAPGVEGDAEIPDDGELDDDAGGENPFAALRRLRDMN